MLESPRPQARTFRHRALLRRPGVPVRHDRWLVSYADFMTLLFAFFTTMYATSTVDVKKLSSVVDSMQRAFVTSGSKATVRRASPARLEAAASAPVATGTDPGEVDLQKELRERLANELNDGRVTLGIDARGVVISMRESGSFPVGNADLTDEARDLLLRIAGTITDLNGSIRVEGHTDDVPIRTSRFGSNWDLSTARAVSVLQFLATSGGLASSRLSASGYGEFHPRVPNDSPEHRAMNRRVDLVVLSPATRAAEDPPPSSIPEAPRDSGR